MEATLENWVQRAHLQMTRGCGRSFCLNKDCGASVLSRGLNPTESAMYLLQLAQRVGRVPTEGEFLFCRAATAGLSWEELSELPLDELCWVLQDPSVLGSCFVAGTVDQHSSGVDWDRLSEFLTRMSAEPTVLAQLLLGMWTDRYSRLYLPRVLVMLLNCSVFMDFEYFIGLSRLCEGVLREGRAQFAMWVEELSVSYLHSCVWVCQQSITMHVISQSPWQSLVPVLQILQVLYEYNEKSH